MRRCIDVNISDPDFCGWFFPSLLSSHPIISPALLILEWLGSSTCWPQNISIFHLVYSDGKLIGSLKKKKSGFEFGFSILMCYLGLVM